MIDVNNLAEVVRPICPAIRAILAVVTGFFVMFFTLFLLAASMVIDDPRWGEADIPDPLS